jgi:hypothetical protein
VAPAIKRCGILARSAMIGFPSRSRPSAIGNGERARSHSGVSSSSRRVTMRAVGFGTSTPTAALPGIGATMRMDCARMASARSSARAAMRPTFTPGAGPTSNCVTTGPVVRPAIRASTRNVPSVSIRTWPSRSSSASPASPAGVLGGCKRSMGGKSSISPGTADRRSGGSTARAVALVFRRVVGAGGLASTTGASFQSPAGSSSPPAA